MTIYDIARLAGVSASTVSRIINNKEGVCQETRDKVKRLLEEYDYTPNETARGLVSRSSKMIGVLIPDIRTIHHTDGVYFIERELAKLGYCSIIFNTGDDDASKADYIEMLRRRRVEGAILMGSAFQSETVQEAINRHLSHVPVVITNGVMDIDNVYGVIADEEEGVADCAAMLLSEGRKHIAFCIDTQTPSNILKRKGYERAMKAAGAECNVFTTRPTFDGAAEATLELLQACPETDAIIYTVDLMAVGGLEALKRLGRKVPEEIAVVGVDNCVYSEICEPKLTSIDNKLPQVSMAAADIMKRLLSGEKVPHEMHIKTEMIRRETA